MKKYSDTYNELNNLLSLLNSVGSVGIIRQAYEKYSNPIPALILEEQINKLQKILDNAKMAKR